MHTQTHLYMYICVWCRVAVPIAPPPHAMVPLPGGQAGASKFMMRAQFGSSWRHLDSGSKLTQHGGFKMTNSHHRCHHHHHHRRGWRSAGGETMTMHHTFEKRTFTQIYLYTHTYIWCRVAVSIAPPEWYGPPPTLNPKPQTLNPKPQTLNPKP